MYQTFYVTSIKSIKGVFLKDSPELHVVFWVPLFLCFNGDILFLGAWGRQTTSWALLSGRKNIGPSPRDDVAQLQGTVDHMGPTKRVFSPNIIGSNKYLWEGIIMVVPRRVWLESNSFEAGLFFFLVALKEIPTKISDWKLDPYFNRDFPWWVKLWWFDWPAGRLLDVTVVTKVWLPLPNLPQNVYYVTLVLYMCLWGFKYMS